MTRVRRDDRGSSLIIALVFLLVFSLWLSATLTATESGLHIAQTARVEPKRLYGADGAIERTIQQIRYDEDEGIATDPDCNTQYDVPDLGQTVYVRCEPDPTSGVGDEGESSPPVGVIALSNGALGESAYQQYGNSIVRIDGGAYSSTPLLFQNGNDCGQQPECQQLNLCPRNEKTVTDGVLVRNSVNVTSLTARFDSLDVGVPIVGNGIPAGTTIATHLGPTSVRMSKAATTGGINRFIRFRENYPRLQNHCHIPTEAEDPDGEHRRKGKVTGVPLVAGGESCDQGRIVALKFNCDATYVFDPVGIDPNYPVDKFSGFSHQSVPACSSFPRVVELQPGRYNDAAALTALTTGCDKIIWFRPGSYYFDFSNDNPVWTIGATNLSNFTVVGGAKTWDREPFTASLSYNNGTKLTTVTATSAVFKASDANAAYLNAAYNLPYKTLIKTVSADRKSATFAGQPLTNNFSGLFAVSPIAGTSNPLGSLCDPATNTDHPGVEFIFGGQSRMLVTDGKTELCSPVVGTRQQIAMYGVKTGQGQLKAQDGCIVAQPYDPNGSSVCAMVKAPQGSKPAFIVHGTIYAPHAAIDLSLQGVGYQVVSRGIIARVVVLRISPSALFTDPLIYSPNFGTVPGAPRKMVLTACIGDALSARRQRPAEDPLACSHPGRATKTTTPVVPGYKVVYRLVDGPLEDRLNNQRCGGEDSRGHEFDQRIPCRDRHAARAAPAA